VAEDQIDSRGGVTRPRHTLHAEEHCDSARCAPCARHGCHVSRAGLAIRIEVCRTLSRREEPRLIFHARRDRSLREKLKLPPCGWWPTAISSLDAVVEPHLRLALRLLL
jgi:hypothetical protein